MSKAQNVIGTELQLCSKTPLTGFFRDGHCETGPQDLGTHTVCAVVTQEFLDYSAAQGNDLITPQPGLRFPGLTPGERWCLCAARWAEANEAGVAPPVVLEATHSNSLKAVALEDLLAHGHLQASSHKHPNDLH
jgi:uncharacterized protein (DUF2237 family)